MAAAGGAVYSFGDGGGDASTILTATILASSTGNPCVALDATFTSNDFNLTQPNDQVVPSADLAPLADYSGPTQTHALLPGSPAIDAADCFETTDPRGVVRPQDGNNDRVVRCDIGAVEVEAARRRK